MLGRCHRGRAAAAAALLIAAGVAGAAAAGASGAAAAEKAFSLTITGAAGARYSGQCTLTRAGGEQTLELAGVVPRHEELMAEAIACRIESAGSITVEIAREGSRSRSTISGGTAHIAVR
jgi:hypothetical protein